MAEPRINGERLRASLLELSRIGATPGGGVTRLSLSDEDRAARDLLRRWCEEVGLLLRVDDLGSIYARLEGSDPSLAPVLIGSHLDSVPLGGNFDGPLGVMSGLEVLRALREADVQPRRSIELVNFTNEEGVRFEPAMMASGVLAGRFEPEAVYARTDAEGRAFGDELRRIGYRGSKADRVGAIHAYLELHIEQGPVLEAEGLPLAAVDGVLGVQWFDITFTGQNQHAGPSPMKGRRDPMIAASRFVVGLRDLALEYGEPAVANVGRLRPTPGVMNQIPAQVVLGANVRHPTLTGLEDLGQRTQELARRLAAQEQCEVEVEVTWNIAPTAFDRSLVELIAGEISALGLPPRRMTAGAGHDAKYVAEIAPTAMLFVRTIGGKSHCESEAIEWEDARLGAEVLLRAALKLVV